MRKDCTVPGAARDQPHIRVTVAEGRPGSTHGYDIVDHHALNPELGDEAAFDRMVAGLRRTGSDRFWISCRIIWAWAARTIRCGWTCWNGDRIRRMPDGSTSIGSRIVRICTTSCWCRFSAINTGWNWRPASSALKFDEEEGSFAVWAYDTHKLPICPLHYRRILGDAHPELERLGDAFAGSAGMAAAGAAPGSRTQGGAGAMLRQSTRMCGRRSRPRWQRVNGTSRRRGELARAARADSESALARGVLSGGGGRHQLPSLFQHQRSRRPAHGTAGGLRSRAPAAVATAGRRNARRAADRSRGWAAQSEGVPGAAAVRGTAGRTRSRFTWWWRRFWR